MKSPGVLKISVLEFKFEQRVGGERNFKVKVQEVMSDLVVCSLDELDGAQCQERQPAERTQGGRGRGHGGQLAVQRQRDRYTCPSTWPSTCVSTVLTTQATDVKIKKNKPDLARFKIVLTCFF